MLDRRMILAVDFDGVIHSYGNGWQDGTIYGHVVPGFWEWARAALPTCRLIVYSSRSKSRIGIDGMQAWIAGHAEQAGTQDVVAQMEWAHEKPPAYLTIDDRAVCFHGDWSAPELSPEGIKAFKPWTGAKKTTAAQVNQTQVAHPDQAAEMERLLNIEDAARNVVVSAMCGEPTEQAIEVLRVACGVECSPT